MEILYCLTVFLHCCKCCVFNLEGMAHLATIVTAIATTYALIYTVSQYESHVEQTKISVLSKYNERYCNSPEIARVIKYIANCLDDNGSLITEQFQNSKYLCTNHDREIFMRFFEEIQISIDNALLDSQYVKKCSPFMPRRLVK